MKPVFERMMFGSAMTLATDVAPKLGEGSYSAGNTNMVAGLLFLMAQEVDRTADTLVRENSTMRDMFARASSEPDIDTELSNKLSEAAEGRVTSYKISALEADNASLKDRLIQLHEFVEGSETEWAQSIDEEIWRLLRQSAQDRTLVFPEMG